ncbi:MAG: hypothetical protein ABL934_10500 [Lysobacteraceae bacterium]
MSPSGPGAAQSLRCIAGVERASAQCGAVTLFGSALNLNIHFHMLWLDGVYEITIAPPQRNHACIAPALRPPRS